MSARLFEVLWAAFEKMKEVTSPEGATADWLSALDSVPDLNMKTDLAMRFAARLAGVEKKAEPPANQIEVPMEVLYSAFGAGYNAKALQMGMIASEQEVSAAFHPYHTQLQEINRV